MTDARQGPLRGILVIVAAGVALGVTYNEIGHRSRHRWGLDWIAVDRLEQLSQLETVNASSDGVPQGSSLYTGSDDPLAVPRAVPSSPELPEIPAAGRPVQIDAGALKQYFDAGAALILDARESFEYDEGHIPGAISLPYDEAITDPVRLESLDTAGRPIITYCGGGGCEVSISLAQELFYAGHDRVAVYIGGFPEWIELGHPVASGPGDQGEVE
jgi:rhodanese-related sulfurtransferase